MKKEEGLVEFVSSEEEEVKVNEEETPEVQEKELPLEPRPKAEKNGGIEIPMSCAAVLASTWQKVLRLMEKDGLFEGEIPENFMVEGLRDGGVILRVVHMPKGIVSVPRDSMSAFDRSFHEDALERDARNPKQRIVVEEEEDADPPTGRRSLQFQDDGFVSVGDK